MAILCVTFISQPPSRPFCFISNYTKLEVALFVEAFVVYLESHFFFLLDTLPALIFFLSLTSISSFQCTAGTGTPAPNISNTTCPTQCSKDFYCKSTHEGPQICAPTCNWKETSDMYSDTVYRHPWKAYCVHWHGLIVWILVMVTGCIRRKQV